jgi:Na+/proline symporter
VAITPALFAALTWKRATRQVGLASIVGSTLAVIFFELILPRIAPSIIESAQGAAGVQVFGGDPWGIPSIYPAAIISIGALILVSLMTPPPKPEELEKLFPK